MVLLELRLNFASSYFGGPITPSALFDTPTGSLGIPNLDKPEPNREI
jgi:hypothetical protein